MKNMKRLLAVLLATLMCLSCLAGLSFADKADVSSRESTETAQPAQAKGFKSTSFRASNSYQYADDEIVTAIVLLKGAAPAELPEAERAAAATRVAAQHNTLRNALRNAQIRYTEEFEYDSLLNGLAISVAYGELEKIAAISSVDAVYIANSYAAPVLEPATRMASSNEMTGASYMHNAGYKGSGMVIAVLDTGITPQHEAFQVYGDTLADAALTQADAEAFIADKGYGKYLSQKIPFSFDYYDQDDDATDDSSGHGTHVSGIAAGYAETEEGEITFCGTAPYAQIVAMKVFGSSGGTNSGIYFAALEDAYELGVDVINMSLGAQNGNTYDTELEDEVYGNIYQTLEDNGIILVASAGNENSMAQYAANWTGGGYVTSDYADYGVVGTPSTYDGNFSIASVENAEYPGYVLTAGEKQIPYYDSDAPQFLTALGGKENVEYVVIDGYGTAADFAGVDVKGKIALVSRGDITFQDKVTNAAEAGALAVLVYNNTDGVIYMSISNYAVPAASISQEDGEYLKSIAVMPEAEDPAEEGTLSVVSNRAARGGNRSATLTMVTDEADLTDGSYVIMNNGLDKVFNGGAGEDINKAANFIAFDDETTEEAVLAAALTYDAETGSFQTPDGKYLSGEENANKIVLSDTPVANAITFDGDGNAAITNNSTQFAFNADWNGFRFYKSSSSVLTDERSPVVLVKLGDDGAEPTEPTDPATDAELVTGWNFETEPTDWTFVDKDGDGYNWAWTNDSAEQMDAYEGSGLIFSESYHNNDDGETGVALEPDNWAISPAINLDGVESPFLSLWAEGQDADWCDENFALYAGTSADPDAMTKLTDDFTATGSYVNYTADLADFAGETIYVAIRHYNVTDQFILNIDQVEIYDGEIPEPPVPVTPELPEGVIYGCYFEEDDDLSQWAIVDNDGDGDTWGWITGYSQYAYEGDGFLISYSYDNSTGALTPDNWVISGPIDLDGVEEASVSVWAAGLDADYAAEVFAIYAGPADAETPDQFTKISEDFTATGDWTNYTADLSDFAGEQICVAIRHYNVTDQYALMIDQFEILSQAAEEPEPVEPVARPVGTLSIPTEQVILDNPEGWQVSSYSSWGVTPILTLKPQIAGIGGDVYSAAFKTEDGYELMSGTSMSAPNVTGLMALTSEYLDDQFGETEELEAKKGGIAMRDGDMPFTDVKQGDYFYDAVAWAISQDPQITGGTSETTFSPTKKCTRGQVMTFLYAYAKKPAVEGENPFTDVAESNYFYNAVLWAVSQEPAITGGTGEGKFSPNKSCTRAQVMMFLWAYAGKPAPTITESPFEDVKPGAYYYDAVLWAYENEITGGVSETRFGSTNTCTRAQVMVFLYKYSLLDDGVFDKVERAELAEKLAQSTALVLEDAEGYTYSPRAQGAGLANMELLTAANAYITEPIQNLFDNADGEFEFTFTVKDLYGEGGTYAVTPLVQTDYAIAADMDQDGEVDSIYNSLTSMPLATEAYEYEGETYDADVEVTAPETVTVPANGSVDVTVSIKLTDATKAYLDQMFPNGAYIEGYILLDAVEGEGEGEDAVITEEIHATYVGFYGDWTKGPILEQHDWREIVDAANFVENTVMDEDGNTYADYGYTWADVVDFQVNTDVNYAYALNYEYLTQNQLLGGYAGDNLYGYDPELAYSDARIALNNAGGVIDTLYMTPYNIRNVRHLIMTATNAETGELYYVDDTEYLPKAYFDDENGYWANSGTFLYDGTDLDGKPVPDGTKVNLTYYANLMYGEDELGAIIGEGDYTKLLDGAKDFVVWEIPVTVDNTAPVVVGEPVLNEEEQTVTFTVKDDNFVAAVYLDDDEGNTVDSVLLGEDEAGAETTVTLSYADAADSAVLKITVCDYAANQSRETPVFLKEPTWVTFNFSVPEGTELVGSEVEYTAYVGEGFTMPEAEGETEQGYFIGWLNMPLNKVVDADTLDGMFTEDTLYYDGGESVTVTEDMDSQTFYALYEIDEPIFTILDVDGDGYGWARYSNSATNIKAHEGDGSIASASYVNNVGALTPDNWAITPAIDLTSAAEAKVSLWAVGQDASYAAENFAIYAGESENPAAMTKVSEDFTATGDWVEYTADLSAFAGKTVYVAVRHYNVTDQYWLVVDDLAVTAGETTVASWGFESDAEFELVSYTTNPNGAEIPDPEPQPADGFVLATELKDGDQVIIYHPTSGMAVSNADLSESQTNYRAGVAVTPEDGKIADPADAIVWTVSEAGGGFIFTDADGKQLACTGNNLLLGTENTVWEIRAGGVEGTVNLVNTNAPAGSSGDPRALEWYAKYNEFSCYYLTATDEAFALQLFVKTAD